MMKHRTKLDIHSFMRSGEIPPLDEEAYVFWQFQNMLLTETDAVRQIADVRRWKAEIAPSDVSDVQERPTPYPGWDGGPPTVPWEEGSSEYVPFPDAGSATRTSASELRDAIRQQLAPELAAIDALPKPKITVTPRTSRINPPTEAE